MKCKCNLCKLRWLQTKARKLEWRLTLLPTRWGVGGYNVYIHPRRVEIEDLAGGEEGVRKQYWEAWLMELPRLCRCN